MFKHAKIRKTYNYLIRFAIVLFTYWYIYDQIFQKKDLPDLINYVADHLSIAQFLWLFLLVIFLMPVNWGLEALKWQYMIGKVEKISIFRSLRAVLAGISVSVFTPNRVGEYFGRVFVLERAGRIEGVLITMLGSMSQLLITLFTGSLGLIIYLPKIFPLFFGSEQYLLYLLIGLVGLLDIILLLIFFNVSVLEPWLKRILSISKFTTRVGKYLRVLSVYSVRELLFILLISLARYLVFTGQLYLLLVAFGLQIPYTDAMVIMTVIFLTMSIIPTDTLTEFGIRGSVSLYFFGLYFTQTTSEVIINMGVVFSTILLWIINLAIPALTGTFFVLKLKFFRRHPVSETSAE
ncbi:MAG: flippase-like domain-containing protein [Bacteroidetes bacterium]|nr:flippase-like domain-containing protein [Bacteroidota bacterium]